jgi:predicted MPP superfamily phosphohydrolase
MERAAIPLLRDETLTLEPIAGIKVDFLGVRWRMTDPTLFESVAYVAKNRDRSHFPICIAHHPHAWDEAVRQGLPLVLSGHTHGGQIMLTDKIGAGPLKFRYWTGVHHRNGSTLVISNGVGNWFPLRVNAPAELLKITIVQAPTSA